MAVVAPGIYLEDRPPRRDQSAPRSGHISSVISIHTAESGTDLEGPDFNAENVANFIRNRATAGSYHLLGDADSIIQLLDFQLQSFQSRGGSNQFVISISLAMNAGDWGKLSKPRKAQLVDTAGQMAAIAARWLLQRGLPIPATARLTKAEAFKRGASGFIDHARLDPERRSDPGSGFPWADFFRAYHAHLTHTGGIDTVAELTEVETKTMDLQRLLISWGADLGDSGPNADGVDGDPGERTVGSATLLIRDLIKRTEAASVEVGRVKASRAESQQLVTQLQQTNAGQATEISQLVAQNEMLKTEVGSHPGAAQIDVWKAKEGELHHLKQLAAEIRQIL